MNMMTVSIPGTNGIPISDNTNASFDSINITITTKTDFVDDLNNAETTLPETVNPIRPSIVVMAVTANGSPSYTMCERMNSTYTTTTSIATTQCMIYVPHYWAMWH